MNDVIHIAKCPKCNRHTTCKIKCKIVDDEIQGTRFRWAKNAKYCECCGTEIYDREYDEANKASREISYEMAKVEEEENHEHHA